MKWIKKGFLVSLFALILCVNIGTYSIGKNVTITSSLVAGNTEPSKENPVGS
ncbi:hypothetical protein ACFQ5F_03375 [Kroppenstedtia eburnea]|uniref:hypothetical protein n=1 Tax=Kroppenstedtia eburnea TaxID=714067 RepID=UPI003638DA4F